MKNDLDYSSYPSQNRSLPDIKKNLLNITQINIIKTKSNFNNLIK